MKTMTKLLSVAALGLGLLVAVPATAKADDSFRISVNLGAPAYHTAYRAPVVEHVYYRPAPQRVVVKHYPARHVKVVKYGHPARYAYNHHRGHKYGHNRFDRGQHRGHGKHRH